MAEDPEGCQFKEHDHQARCSKICAPGQRLCPYHLMITQHERLELNESTKTYKTPRGYQE